MRNISFAMSVEAVRRREKTVTRRFGWWGPKPGARLQPVEKAQGLRKGEHVTRIGGPIRVRSVTAEPLEAMATYGPGECVREGFPELSVDEFIAMFCAANRCTPDVIVNRIEFEYVGEGR